MSRVRKSDMGDAEWIAQLDRCGLIRSFYVPSLEVMDLRSLIRRWQSYTQERTQAKNELYTILQRSNSKLTGYLSDIFSKTGTSFAAIVYWWRSIYA